MDAFKFASRRNRVEGDVKDGVINVILDKCSMTWHFGKIITLIAWRHIFL